MANIVFLASFSNEESHRQSGLVELPLESLITYCIYKYCSPQDVTVSFVYVDRDSEEYELKLQSSEPLNFIDKGEVPWQVASCIYPVVMFEDTIITGLCAVARHICNYRALPKSRHEHVQGILGFREGCLQAPNEVSIWTKFCEVDIIRTVLEVLRNDRIEEIPKNLVRFENHLNKPVRVHNVYKLARDLKKETAKDTKDSTEEQNKQSTENDKTRVPKTRKWKSNRKKNLAINFSTKIEDLNICHQFAEGPFLTLADLVLVPSYYIMVQSFGEPLFESTLPLTFKWFNNIINVPELKPLIGLLKRITNKSISINSTTIPTTEDVSLYKCDPKRHNPKKRLFTKEDDIENALCALMDGMELSVIINNFTTGIEWTEIPDGANPSAGHLPDVRMARKSQQLENLTLAVLNIAKEGDLIVDFCSGSGHLGILIAHLLPQCTVILLENKEQSLLRARKRVHDMGLSNVFFFQCNLDFFIGKFDIGVALHACGIASDLVLDKCLKANAKFVLCPCCYGSLHATDRLVYPRSSRFSGVTIDQYLCIGHAADQTHEDHPLMVRGAKCMAVIDSDRGRLAEEFGYKVTLSRLKPLSCTPKNNLLIGVPS